MWASERRALRDEGARLGAECALEEAEVEIVTLKFSRAS